jgi:hypothetical protein
MMPPSDRELLITRVFDAPRELVFALWTEREHVMRWWGPRDFTTHVFEGDFIPGSAWRACMRSAQGKGYFSSYTTSMDVSAMSRSGCSRSSATTAMAGSIEPTRSTARETSVHMD